MTQIWGQVRIVQYYCTILIGLENGGRFELDHAYYCALRLLRMSHGHAMWKETEHCTFFILVTFITV